MSHEGFFQKLEEKGMLVNSPESLGWGFWPSKGGGYFDEHTLRILADEIERRNKPFWDEYDRYCEEQLKNPPKLDNEALVFLENRIENE